MTDDRLVDDHLVAILNKVLDAVYQAKQAAWATTGAPNGEAIKELVGFLIDWSGTLSEAEERIEGRSDEVSSPSSHQRGNLVAKANGDLAQAIRLLSELLSDLAGDIRTRTREIPDADDAPMLLELAAELDKRIETLEPA